MATNFTTKAKATAKAPTVADALASGQVFKTSYGTVYVKAQGGQLVKLGNPDKTSRNFVAVKDSSYFAGRESEAVTLLGDLTVAI